MSTTIKSLRKLGLKVNGSEPTANNIGNVINEIADDYQGGSGSAGVSSIGGVDGAITLGTGLSMSGQELQVSVSGGTKLYKHAVSIDVDLTSLGMGHQIVNINMISTAVNSTALTTATLLTAFDTGNILSIDQSSALFFDRSRIYTFEEGGTTDELYMYIQSVTEDSSGNPTGVTIYKYPIFVMTDTVVAL